MNANSIASIDAVVQQERPYYNGKPRKDNGDVWCPMCDMYHVNNTWCQANMEVGHEL